MKKDRGDFKEAEAGFRHALAMFEASVGPDHQGIVIARGGLAHAIMLQNDDRSHEGRASVEEALVKLKAPPHSLPATDPWVTRFSNYLAGKKTSKLGH